MADAVPQLQGLLQGVPAKVEVTVFGAYVLAAVGIVLDGERRSKAGVQHIDAFEPYLYVAGGHLRVLAGALHHLTGGLDDELAAEAADRLNQFCGSVGFDYQLGYAVAVPEVYEGHTSKFTGALHPSCECYFLSCV